MQSNKIHSLVNFQYPMVWIGFSIIFALLLRYSDGLVVRLSTIYDAHLLFLSLNASGPLASSYAKACTVVCLSMSLVQTASLLMLDRAAFRKVARFSTHRQLNAAIAIATVSFVILFFVETIDRITLVYSLGWLAAPVLIPVATSIFPLLVGLVAFKLGFYGGQSTTESIESD